MQEQNRSTITEHIDLHMPLAPLAAYSPLEVDEFGCELHSCLKALQSVVKWLKIS